MLIVEHLLEIYMDLRMRCLTKRSRIHDLSEGHTDSRLNCALFMKLKMVCDVGVLNKFLILVLEHLNELEELS